MADKELASILDIQHGLGVPDNLKRVQDVKGEALSWVDASLGTQRIIAAKSLLGDSVWHIHNQLGSEDFSMSAEQDHTIMLNYAVEPTLGSLQRGAITSALARYPPAALGGKPCRVTHRALGSQCYLSSAAEAQDTLAQHLVGVNAHTSVGVSREMLHLQTSRRGSEMRSVYVRMWLAHLSIRTDRGISVTVDRPKLRKQLRGVDGEIESDAARMLRGVRVNARGMSDTTLALLIIGCSDLNSVTDLHGRARRYKFPTASLTVYGDSDARVTNVHLQDPKQTGAAIVTLSHRYGHFTECGEALRTALVLFGMSVAGRNLTIASGEPDLHDDIHSDPAGATYPYERYSDLGEKRMLSLSLFLGRAWRQSFGHTLRASLFSIAATDVDAARDCILPNHRTMMSGAATIHTEATKHFATLIDSSSFVVDNYSGLWRESGVAHSLAMGVVIEGSVLDEATRPITLPTINSLSPVDDPGSAKAVGQAWSALSLVDSLIRMCGETLVGSQVARLDNVGTSMHLSTEATNLCGSTVMFTLLGVGSGVTINRSEAGFVMDPPCTTTTTNPSMPVIEHTPLSLTASLAKPMPAQADINSLIGTYAPSGSTMARRRVDPGRPTRLPDISEAVVVSNQKEEGILKELVASHAVVKPTSGEGLLCGANALQISLGDHEMHLTSEHIAEAIRSAMTPEEVEMAAAAGVSLTASNFTADQLARGLQALGNYALYIVNEDEPIATVSRHDNGDERARPVWVHYKAGHWSGIGIGEGRALSMRRTERAQRR